MFTLGQNQHMKVNAWNYDTSKKLTVDNDTDNTKNVVQNLHI